jgi:hypothetical protein
MYPILNNFSLDSIWDLADTFYHRLFKTDGDDREAIRVRCSLLGLVTGVASHMIQIRMLHILRDLPCLI